MSPCGAYKQLWVFRWTWQYGLPHFGQEAVAVVPRQLLMLQSNMAHLPASVMAYADHPVPLDPVAFLVCLHQPPASETRIPVNRRPHLRAYHLGEGLPQDVDTHSGMKVPADVMTARLLRNSLPQPSHLAMVALHWSHSSAIFCPK